MKEYIYVLGAWNIIVFMLYGIDKGKAKRHEWRISEKVLITAAFLFGSLGALLGMLFFHHKTKHWMFRIFVPLALMLNILLGYWWLVK